MKIKFKSEIAKFAEKCYNDANCKYDGKSYMIHIYLVSDYFVINERVFKNIEDAQNVSDAIFTHDLIEDAKQTYNNILDVCGKDVADITLAVTDVPAENRLMRHLLTMPKTVKDYRAIILKMCDMCANAHYSKDSGSSMFKKYVEEYKYRKPIFAMALKWYSDKLDQQVLNAMWDDLDKLHGYVN